jgi:hypothetical protein
MLKKEWQNIANPSTISHEHLSLISPGPLAQYRRDTFSCEGKRPALTSK